MVEGNTPENNSVLLSLRAIGLLRFYRDTGRALPANEVAAFVKEGRDAIRAAMKELEDAGLIKFHKFQINGQWRTEVQLVQKPFSQEITGNGFSGPLPEDPLLTTSDITTSDISTSTNDYSLDIDTYTNKKSKLRLVKEEKKKKEEKTITKESDFLPGISLHRLGIDPIGDPNHRSNKPEDKWTTKDLVTEFMHIAYDRGFASVSIPGDEVGKIMNKLFSDGLTRYQILKLIRKFFLTNIWPSKIHPRSLWASFMQFAYEWKDTVDKEPVSYALSPEALKHQKKMLKLLQS
jgi:hypothetical protein